MSNIHLALAFTFMGSASRGIWSFATLSNYLQGMTGDVLSVGVAEGVQGICQALVALLAGWYADKFSRDLVLKFAGVLGLITVGFMSMAILIPGWDFHNQGDVVWTWMNKSVRYPMLVIALGCWGAYQGVWNTSLETIYADSVPTGQRSFYNTRKFVLLQLASISGPVGAIVLFCITGNDWGQHTLTMVFFIGLLATIPSIMCLFFFRDELTVSRDGSALSAADAGSKAKTITRTGGSPIRRTSFSRASTTGALNINVNANHLSTTTPLSIKHSTNSEQPPPLISAVVTPQKYPSQKQQQLPSRSISRSSQLQQRRRQQQQRQQKQRQNFRCFRCISQQFIPHVIIFSDLISGFGSGMTVKFFPLFFSKKLHLSPIATNSIYIVVPVFMTIMSLCAQTLSKKYGRVQISILYAYIGAIALFVMYILGCISNDHWEEWPLFSVLPLYFISTAQHCVRPLKKSILMDYVPVHQRGRWNSLDSVTRFGWSGSALVGGWIVDHWSYSGSFFITAMVQILASTLLVTLIRLVPLERSNGSGSSVFTAGGDSSGGKGRRNVSTTSTNRSSLSESLLVKNNPNMNNMSSAISIGSSSNTSIGLSTSQMNNNISGIDNHHHHHHHQPQTLEESEDVVSRLNSTWHGDSGDWRRSSIMSGGTVDFSQKGTRSQSFDETNLYSHDNFEFSQVVDDRQEGISMAVYDALSEMQSPLMNSFLRRGDC